MCLKKVPTFELSVTFLLTDLQNSSTATKCVKFAAKSADITHLTLGMLLHYLGKLKIQIFCIYSTDMEENVNNCILSAVVFQLHAICRSVQIAKCAM